MIRIVIDKDQREKIENIYCHWINRHLKSFERIVRDDKKCIT